MWKEIANFSGCNTFEELQQYMELTHKIKVNINDFQSQHPITLSKLFHIYQMIILYYQYSQVTLDNLLEDSQVSLTEFDEQIAQYEELLSKQKAKLKYEDKKLQREKKQRDKYLEVTKNYVFIQCIYCEKILTSTSDFDDHIKKVHKDELNTKEVNIMYKAMQNLMAQQQLSITLQKQQMQQQAMAEYQFLQKTKLQLGKETKEFIDNTFKVNKIIESTQSKYEQEIKSIKQDIKVQERLFQVRQDAEFEQQQEIVKEKILDVQTKIQQYSQALQNQGGRKNTKNLSNITSKQQLYSRQQTLQLDQEIMNENEQLQSARSGNQVQSARSGNQAQSARSGNQVQSTKSQQQQIQNFNYPQMPSNQINEVIMEQSPDQSIIKTKKKLNQSISNENDTSEELQIRLHLFDIKMDQYKQAKEKLFQDVYQLMIDRNNNVRIKPTDLQKKYYVEKLETTIRARLIDLEGKDAKKLKEILEGLRDENDKYEENCKKEVLGDAMAEEDQDKIDHESLKKHSKRISTNLVSHSRNISGMSQSMHQKIKSLTSPSSEQ